MEYDAWISWGVTLKCNFHCDYCIISSIIESNEKIKEIDVEKLLRTLDNTKKTFLITLSGGEPFLVPNFTDACKRITEKHFITLNTNLTSDRIKDFAEKIDPKRVKYIVASFHLKELERTNLVGKYVSNLDILRKKGFNVLVQEVGYPPYIKELIFYKDLFRKMGVVLTFQKFIGELDGKKYPEAYTDEEIETFGMKDEKGEGFNDFFQNGQICNAGYNACVAYQRGDIHPCFQFNKEDDKTKIGNLYKEIRFNDDMMKCPFDSCSCPLNQYDKKLFDKALKETNNKKS